MNAPDVMAARGSAGDPRRGAERKSRWLAQGVLAGVCALVAGIYVYTAHSGFALTSGLSSSDEYYNLLVQGFRAGQLNVLKAVPAGFANLADPYSPTANAPYRVLDMSYYREKLYLYFGVTPAVMLFWPYAALTGHYLPQKYAAVIFCFIGFLAGVGVVHALWQRYCSKVGVGVVAVGVFALGLANGTPLLLARCDTFETSISCGHMLVMLSLAAVWSAIHQPARRGWYLAAASLAYGLAVGARPSLLWGGVLVLIPIGMAWRERQSIGSLVVAATLPMLLIGLGLMLYNWMRFDNPFEFGIRYALAGDRQPSQQWFGLSHFWFNFRLYFLEPARWTGRFPFVRDIVLPPFPAGHGVVEHPFGVLTNVPLVWLALAAPLIGRRQDAEARSRLLLFFAVLALFSTICALTICCFFSTSIRYWVDFLPPWVLLAVIGILGVEQSLRQRNVARLWARCGWVFLVGVSMVFNLLVAVVRCAEAHHNYAGTLQESGHFQEAMKHYEQALRLQPDYASSYNNLGVILMKQGRPQQAISRYEQSIRLKPDFAEAHYNLGVALARSGGLPQQALEQFQRALEIKPDLPEAHNALGLALAQAGRRQEALSHFTQALRLRPGFESARLNLVRWSATP